jgi:hypothetical protein
LFGPRSALLTRLNGKSAALPQILSTKARERNLVICTSRINKDINVTSHARWIDLLIHGFKLDHPSSQSTICQVQHHHFPVGGHIFDQLLLMETGMLWINFSPQMHFGQQMCDNFSQTPMIMLHLLLLPTLRLSPVHLEVHWASGRQRDHRYS